MHGLINGVEVTAASEASPVPIECADMSMFKKKKVC